MKGIILSLARRRKSIRRYKNKAFSVEKILYAIRAAIEAPSGANQQPWRFIIVDDPQIKIRIREICEKGEKEFYAKVSGELKEWLIKRGFTWKKPFLTEAPYLIVVLTNMTKLYAVESTWLSIGYLLLALEEEGLASLTYTPPNPKDVMTLLGVPSNFELQAIIPVGLPAEDKQKESRKGLHEVVYHNVWGSKMNIASTTSP